MAHNNILKMKLTSEKKLPIKMPNRSTVQQKFEGSASREVIEKYVQNQSNLLAKSGFQGKIQITMKYPDGSFKSGKYTDVGEIVNTDSTDGYEEEEEDDIDFSEFRLYITKYK